MIKPEIEIIEKVLNNKASKEEVKQVLAWFKTDEGQEWLSERMNQDEKNIRYGKEEELIDQEIPSVVMYQRIMSQIRKQKIRRILFQVAAVVLPLVLFAGLFFQLDSQVNLFPVANDYEEVLVARGEQTRVVFQDGSSVLLNSGSKIRYPKQFSFNKRKVELTGEGYFEVSKNRRRPFYVELDKMDVKVLGTSFDVRAFSDERTISVRLDEGLVELSSDDFSTVQLNPGEKAEYDRNTRICTISKVSDREQGVTWKEDYIVFDNTPFKEAVQELSRIFDVDFLIEDEEVYDYTLTIVMENEDLSTCLEELHLIVPFRFVCQNGAVHVYKK